MKIYSLIALPTFLFAVAASPATAQETSSTDAVPAQELRINYDMKMGGFSLGSGRLRATFTEDSYVATTRLHTEGLADFLFQSTYVTVSQGAMADSAILPEFYTSDFDGRGDEYQIVRIGYDETTPYLVESDPSYGRRLERFPVTDEQRENSFDPLNAAIHLITGSAFSEDQPCGETIQIFDGRRRYNLNMTFEGIEDISVRNGEVWDGDVTVCKLTYEEIAGFKPQPEDEDLPRRPLTLYIAATEEGFHIPVRVRAPTPIGSMVLSASHFRISDIEVPGSDIVDVTVAAPNLAPTE